MMLVPAWKLFHHVAVFIRLQAYTTHGFIVISLPFAVWDLTRSPHGLCQRCEQRNRAERNRAGRTRGASSSSVTLLSISIHPDPCRFPRCSRETEGLR